jgi:hypothetical protein
MFRWTTMLVLTAGLTMAASTQAADGDEKKGPRPGAGRGNFGEMIFKRLDADDNGKITKEEIKKGGENARFNVGEKIGEAFDKLDADKSGDLSAEEFKKFGEQVRGNLAGRFDREKLKELRGKIDPEKLKQLRERFQNRKPPIK